MVERKSGRFLATPERVVDLIADAVDGNQRRSRELNPETRFTPYRVKVSGRPGAYVTVGEGEGIYAWLRAANVTPTAASVAEFLWERLGGLLYDYLGWCSGGCRGLSRHCDAWEFVVDEFEEEWLERLANVALSESDWVHYRAASQRLGTVCAMLEPFCSFTVLFRSITLENAFVGDGLHEFVVEDPFLLFDER